MSQSVSDKHSQWSDSGPIKSLQYHWNLLKVSKVKDGWGPLCAFLGLQKPSTPFPRSNSGQQVPTFLCGNYKWIITILNKVQLLASQLRRTAYVGVLGAPLILSVLVPFCHSTWQLCLTPILPCLFLWSVVKIFLRTLDGDVWFPFVVLDWS